jgi:hypothetical protein
MTLRDRGGVLPVPCMSPLCESYVVAERLADVEPFDPLDVYVSGQCFVVQLHESVSPASIFTEYAYFRRIQRSGNEPAASIVKA